MTTINDHMIFAILAAALPVYGAISWRQLRRRIARGDDGARLAAYTRTIVIEWALAIAVLLLWIAAGRSGSSLGIVVSADPAFLAAAAIAAAGLVLLMRQARAMRGLEPDDSLRRQLAPVEALMPHSPGERTVFLALAITAGFCEEVLYRGFLTAYLNPWLGPWGALAGSAALFGIAHAYQGAAGVLKSAAIGAVLGGLYLWSGSLLPAVVLHTALDLQGGAIGYEVFGRKAGQPA